MILAEYRVVLETPNQLTPKEGRKLLSQMEFPPDSEIQSNLESVIGNFLPITVTVRTLREP